MYWEYRARGEFDARVLTSYARGIAVSIGGVMIKLDPALSFQIARSIVRHDYESTERALIEAALHPDDVVVELGTGLGYIATVCALIVGSDNVFTYEANPGLEPLIRSTFALNGVSPTLTIGICGKQKDTKQFFVTSDFWVSSTEKPSFATESIFVDVVPFQHELERIKPTVLILDIEGGEYDIIQSFSFETCRLIMFELHPAVLGANRSREVLQRLDRIGFRCKLVSSDCYLYERMVDSPWISAS
jgi:FkbM family methyltransferase